MNCGCSSSRSRRRRRLRPRRGGRRCPLGRAPPPPPGAPAGPPGPPPGPPPGRGPGRATAGCETTGARGTGGSGPPRAAGTRATGGGRALPGAGRARPRRASAARRRRDRSPGWRQWPARRRRDRPPGRRNRPPGRARRGGRGATHRHWRGGRTRRATGAGAGGLQRSPGGDLLGRGPAGRDEVLAVRGTVGDGGSGDFGGRCGRGSRGVGDVRRRPMHHDRSGGRLGRDRSRLRGTTVGLRLGLRGPTGWPAGRGAGPALTAGASTAGASATGAASARRPNASGVDDRTSTGGASATAASRRLADGIGGSGSRPPLPAPAVPRPLVLDGWLVRCGCGLRRAGAFLAAAFLAGFGSSGCSARVSPSRIARRRIMSAYASLSDDEWLFTGTPSFPARSIASAFVIPSSLASSCTLMFFAIVVPY